MAYKVFFESYEQLVTFITYATDFNEWGCRKFTLTSFDGATMDMDTKKYVSGNSREYIPFASLKSYINTFYVNNGSKPIRLDIKLVCPASFKATADPNNYYQNFFINIYSYNNTTNYLNLSYEENGINLIEEPYTTFVSYVRRIYDAWKTYYADNYGY